ncbi:MAG TPA: patatin-like phospholipase family protein [Anaerolineae bacterium]
MSVYRILSLDGGGIRALQTAILLERLEASVPGYLTHVNLFAGTSAGGILALALAAGYTPAEAHHLYLDSAASVFADRTVAEGRERGITAAFYGNENLKASLLSIFGQQTLADLPQRVLVPAFDLDNQATGPGQLRTWKLKFFHNFPGPDSDGHERVVDVAMRTSAAPIYFPIYQGYVDGGIVVKNPAMCAVAQAIDAATGGQTLPDVALLSVGTGRNPNFLELGHDDGDWGSVQWSADMRLLGVTMGNDVDVVDYQCRRFLGQRYHRLDPLLSQSVHLDGMAELRRLMEVARAEDLATTTTWLQRHFKEPT